MPIVLASCGGTQKTIVQEPILKPEVEKTKVVVTDNSKQQTEAAKTTTAQTQTPATVTKTAPAIDAKSLSFLQKIFDNRVFSQNITGKMSLTMQRGGKDITVPGALHMRKNEIIRIQIFMPFLGSELARLEFTPEYVLILDKIHKMYTKAEYNQVSFLKSQGITFYSLQALFWNQLLLPGKKEISDADLTKFTVNLNAQGDVPVSYKSGAMTYLWKADRNSGKINAANVSYKSAKDGTSSVDLLYSDFQSVGVKQFPGTQNVTFVTSISKKRQVMKLNMEMDEVKTKDNWDVKTNVPSNYKQVTPEELLSKISSL